MVRVSESAHARLKEVAGSKGLPMQTILEEAIEDYRRKAFLDGLSEDFAALRADTGAWAEEEQERTMWERTLQDGLDRE